MMRTCTWTQDATGDEAGTKYRKIVVLVCPEEVSIGCIARVSSCYDNGGRARSSFVGPSGSTSANNGSQ